MKLQEKETKEIWTLINRNEGTSAVLWVSNGSRTQRIESIEELTSRFEDYEEPKEQYYIKENGTIGTCGAIEDDIPDEMLSEMKSIGNYFESEEEAEKAVEKLKTWQRLKDKGFRFTGVGIEYGGAWTKLLFNKGEDEDWVRENLEDLRLLFRGEE